MSDPSADLRLSSYDYDLPPSFIAQTPAEPRHSARLLALGRSEEQLRHLSVWDLSAELRPGDLLVVNDTRVLKARLQARRASGGAVELLVLQPYDSAVPREAAVASSECCWICLVRPAKRVRPGEVLQLEAAGLPSLPLEVVALDESSGGRVIRFPPGCVDAASIEALLERYGAMPLPPYIQHPDPEQESRYQTRYATRPGAVAAPTAGLHLSDELLEAIRARGVAIATATLHVGIGTFRPLEEEDLSSLDLHSEWVEISQELVEAVAACQLRGGRVVAVGTTSVRSLEGVAALHGGHLVPFRGPVNLVIQPGFRFQLVQGLLTNFHLPRSSLLLLVSALIGRPRLLEVYEEAKRQGYRFFSYGDAMWIAPDAVLEAASP
ncbi:tRNA preQ1(34) S-adenosylmethionine ribosyltransferase-isomerase QueA [Synechococcus sp. RedBA-s]|uniref:tRNA preQ1(34) S-adenosylmethionine ribosyltransferase-isomerase QueA n=1 Tax=Synechococcus sp. RedBA-s TaxID=2823741 RepID=UPI0020CCB738|nr:tRNA preQ1(34) S-adenosylmethionine ribosyltransferase-isomerase QueA [Synechococcus sp. RedBA-s]MCP9801251.1 tRNA preQ1(34) S-adenosylmethionine ribosyltransferase-isomerase QueA [Synechococcus sp. RedBA-s]